MTKDLILDSPETTVEHGAIIQNKYFLKKIYEDVYSYFKCNMSEGSHSLELGSGGGFIKDFIPNVTTSDVIELPFIDKVVYAESLPYEVGQLSNLFMFNVLHHVQDSEAFLFEAIRVLKPGGRIIMAEPANTIFSRFIYSYFHHEPCEPEQEQWRLESGGRLSMANAMLPWIIFKRDEDKFKKLFPQLEIIKYQNFMPFKYIISGGLSSPQLLPNFTYDLYSSFEKMISPLNNYLGMFVRIIVERR